MITYSSILKQVEPRLKELGLEGESHIMNEYGEQVFTASEATESLKAKVLEWEINTRKLVRGEKESTDALDKVQKEREQNSLLYEKMWYKIQEFLPHGKLRPEFKEIWYGFMQGVVRDLQQQATFHLDESGNLKIGERKENAPEGELSELDRILASAHVTRYKTDESDFEDLLNKVVPHNIRASYFDEGRREV